MPPKQLSSDRTTFDNDITSFFFNSSLAFPLDRAQDIKNINPPGIAMLLQQEISLCSFYFNFLRLFTLRYEATKIERRKKY